MEKEMKLPLVSYYLLEKGKIVINLEKYCAEKGLDYNKEFNEASYIQVYENLHERKNVIVETYYSPYYKKRSERIFSGNEIYENEKWVPINGIESIPNDNLVAFDAFSIGCSLVAIKPRNDVMSIEGFFETKRMPINEVKLKFALDELDFCPCGFEFSVYSYNKNTTEYEYEKRRILIVQDTNEMIGKCNLHSKKYLRNVKAKTTVTGREFVHSPMIEYRLIDIGSDDIIVTSMEEAIKAYRKLVLSDSAFKI